MTEGVTMDRQVANALMMIDDAAVSYMLHGGANGAWWRGMIGDALDVLDRLPPGGLHAGDMTPNQVSLIEAARAMTAGPVAGAATLAQAESRMRIALGRIRADRIARCMDVLGLQEGVR